MSVMRGSRALLAGVFAASAASLAGLTGCVVGPNYQRPPLSIPEAHRGATVSAAEAASLADQAWWDVFRDDALKGLLNEAFKNGYDLRLAAARVEEARANAGINRALYLPTAQLSAQVGRGRDSDFSSTPGQGSIGQVNLGLNWEIDLFGRIRRLNEAALAQYLSSEAARRGVVLSLVSEIATDYFKLRELDLELEIAKRTTGAFGETYDLFDRRLKGGAASALETSSAQASLAATAANIPDLERQIVEQENRLSLLMGRNPGAIPRGAVLNDQFLPPEIPAGLPSDLLKRRPDLTVAEENLIAANANVGVARADFFPVLSLTGALGGLAPQVSQLFGPGKTWAIGAGLLSPVFQPGRLENQYRAAVARWEEAKVQYEQSVATAFSEVSTALVAYQKYSQVETERQRAVTANREAVRLSNERYVAGFADYLEVLQAQQQLFPAELLLAEARYNRLATLAELYRTLGGGWQLKDPASEPSSSAAKQP
ncbi:MAG TPA: efflux transporter outer membrane subunit [Thermoanaerobaculia bacterium]|nr:efflux transporter outer membrane subunit [Thermoanaerobaculia bacterium]